MSQRVNPFANVTEAPVFEVKPKRETPVAKETIERLAEDNNFPSRQATKPYKELRRNRRLYTTGRNRQINLKVSTETLERLYKMADEKRVPLCELLELALEALEGAGGPDAKSSVRTSGERV